jgi:PPIC-type PPIASE domain
MLRSVFFCLLAGALAWGQGEKPAATAKSPATRHPAVKTAPAETSASPAVITIPGVCNKTSAKLPPADCKTVVTRAEFEEVVEAIQPDMPPAAKRQFAERYAAIITMSQTAHNMGLDHGSAFDEMMKLMRMQVLAQALAKNVRDKANVIPTKDIEDYYHNNSGAYEEATLYRIFVPKSKQLEAPKEGASEADNKKRQDDAEADMKKEADSLHDRAVAGEDFDKLQAEALQTANVKMQPPPTKLTKTRRTQLPPDQSSVFDLKPGTVSSVLPNQNGYFIYKLEEKDTLPLEQVREEIHTTLQNQRIQDSMQQLQQSAKPVLDESYFAVPGAPRPPQFPSAGHPAPAGPVAPSGSSK